MRASDRKKNMKKANILAESLYRQRNNEDYDYAGEEIEYNNKMDYENMGVEEFIGTPVSLHRKLVNNFKNDERLINGIFADIDKSEGVPLMIIEKDGKKVAYIMYDKNKNAFIDGMSTWGYYYTPMDAETAELLKRFSK